MFRFSFFCWLFFDDLRFTGSFLSFSPPHFKHQPTTKIFCLLRFIMNSLKVFFIRVAASLFFICKFSYTAEKFHCELNNNNVYLMVIWSKKWMKRRRKPTCAIERGCDEPQTTKQDEKNKCENLKFTQSNKTHTNLHQFSADRLGSRHRSRHRLSTS